MPTHILHLNCVICQKSKMIGEENAQNTSYTITCGGGPASLAFRSSTVFGRTLVFLHREQPWEKMNSGRFCSALLLLCWLMKYSDSQLLPQYSIKYWHLVHSFTHSFRKSVENIYTQRSFSNGKGSLPKLWISDKNDKDNSNGIDRTV